MHKKQFELIAKVLREAKAVSSFPLEIDRVSAAFAEALAGTNELFDHGRFLRACDAS